MPDETQNQSLLLLPGDSNSPLARLLSHNDIIFALGVAMVLATLLLPLPTFLMDWLLGCSIAIALGTLIVVLSTKEPLELSTFPSLLLFVTLFRLSLNVATTRLILLHGDAGEIIDMFGHVVAAGSLPIGVVVFLILVIIQFVVITKGAERISEVAARFNLDGMPGKQMAIDADLNAGLIGEDEARQRREKIVKESEFYGAMDGASKFIRGDAIAGLIITVINLIGGFIVGMTAGLSASQAVQKYAILAVGDGLISQIPALLIATASGFLITKSSSKGSISHDLIRQMIARSRPLGIVAFLLAAMVFVPGFPPAPFIILSLGTGLLARALAKGERRAASASGQAKPKPATEKEPVEELLDVDRISVQVGPRLIKVVDPRRKTSLSNRIAPLRRKFATQMGIILPLIRLRDNVSLESNTYEIRMRNHVVGTGRLEPDMFMAMDPGTVQNPIQGIPGHEPVFNLPAIWIEAGKKEQAELAGYTVVDPENVLITHLSETLKRHAHELLSRDDVQTLIDRLREKQPALVNGVVGESVSIGLLQRVLQGLLKDGIPVRDLSQILETVGDHADRTKDPAVLTEMARKALVWTITEQYSDQDGKISAIALAPPLEYELRNSLAADGAKEAMNVTPERAMELSQKITETWQAALSSGVDKPVMLTDFRIRPHLAAMLSRQLPQLPVLAYDEIAMGTEIQSVGTVSLQIHAEAGAEAVMAAT